MFEFHFLRPWWLALLPVGLWLGWRLTRAAGFTGKWRQFVDRALQPYVLAGAEATLRERRFVLIAAAIAWTLTVLALAGPTWERQPVPALRSDEALVVVLDLSRSMDAADVEPSRLARAKLKLLGLLERRTSGQTGLVVFSGHAFAVSPLTTDTRNIASLVAALSTDIMPSRGSYPEAGLRKGAQLLEQAGVSRGELLLMTDTEVSTVAESVVEGLRLGGYTVSVLAIGTPEGAPIVVPGGGFLTDASGQVVVPQVDVRGLRRLALIGGGRFATLTPDDRDLDTLFPIGVDDAGRALDADAEDPLYQSDLWRDQGLWLVLLILPFVALAFRRGWIVVWCLWLMLPAPRADALEWADLWSRPDQRGAEAFEAEAHARAAELFEDPSWSAAALYRAGEYARSAEILDEIDTIEANYNRGNALARAGEIGPAIKAYERALELDPEHEDARFNRDLLREQRPPESEGQEQGEPNQQDSDQQSQQSASQQAASQSSDQTEPADPESMSPEDAEASESSQASSQSQNADPNATEEFEPLPTPGELEEWASEQAADQWLRRIPEDPGGLLRRKFMFQYQRLGVDQDGNYVWPGDEEQPW